MGRVLLAGRPAEEIDEYIARTDFKRLTSHTVTNPREFRSILEQVRSQGYALVDQELEEGVRSIAAPIVNTDGEVIAALNVSGHAARVSVAQMRKEFRPRLLATAAQVSERASTLLGV